MTGAKLGQRVGWVRIFRVVVVVFALSSLLMIFSPTVAGISAMAILPASRLPRYRPHEIPADQLT